MPRESTQFKLGHPGGPGRPKGSKSVPDTLRRILDEVTKDETGSPTTKLELIMRRVVDQALAGDHWAITWSIERTEGKALETVRTIAEEFYDNTNDPVEDPPMIYCEKSSGAIIS